MRSQETPAPLKLAIGQGDIVALYATRFYHNFFETVGRER